jgi:hypothetical protein
MALAPALAVPLVVLPALILGAASGASTPASTAAAVPQYAVSASMVSDAYTPIVAGVLGEPTSAFKGTDGKYHVVYDLELQNASSVPATLERLDVVDANDPSKTVTSYEGPALLDRLRSLVGDAGKVTDASIAPSSGRVVYVDFAVDRPGAAPLAVLHRLALLGAAAPPATEATRIGYVIARSEISAGKKIVIAPPLRGRGWVALNGCCTPGLPHRSSFAPFNGRIANGQRFAIDWKRMNERGEFYEGDKTRNENYIDYGAEVLAVANGTVVATLDALEPNAPGLLPALDPVKQKEITVETVDGNHIVVDLGGDVYAFYGHLQKGTLNVRPGDKVRTGEVIARLGNTGNSNVPHLHFHLMDGPSVLGSNGLPYVITAFDYAGQVPAEPFILPESAGGTDDYLTGKFGSQRLAPPQTRTDELPLGFAIVDFPG